MEGRMPASLALPLEPEQVQALHVGDEVLVSGRLITGRAAAHRWLAAEDAPAVRAVARGSMIYHCGPVVAREDPGGWRIVAAGPTASMRMEEHQAAVIARYGLRGVIGKGGMGPRTQAALRECGAVYLHAVGGLAVVLARCVVRVHGVHRLEELGVPEAIWDIEVRDYPAVVTMDAHGKSLHERPEDDPVHLAAQLMGTAPGSSSST
jgi:fumarate hydratase subunit beta